MPWETAQALAGIRTPQPDRLVFAGAGDYLALRMKTGSVDDARMPSQYVDARTGLPIPDPDRGIHAGTSQQLRVSTVTDGCDIRRVALQSGEQTAVTCRRL